MARRVNARLISERKIFLETNKPLDNFNVYAFPSIRKKSRMDGAPSFIHYGSATPVGTDNKQAWTWTLTLQPHAPRVGNAGGRLAPPRLFCVGSPLCAQAQSPGFRAGQSGGSGARGAGFHPDAGQGPPHIPRRNPGAAQAKGPPDQRQIVLHDSSLSRPHARLLSGGAKAQSGGYHQARWTMGSGGARWLDGKNRLTRSIHRLNAVKSGEETVSNQTRGGYLSAHRGTEANPAYSEVLVRIQCS
jgi:hypothetical protein